MKPKTQKQHELDSHRQAIEDLDRQVNDAKSKAYFSSTLQARETMKQLGPDMTRGLVDWLTEVQKGKAVTLCAPAYAPELLNLMGFAKPEVITIILLKSVLDTHGQFESPTVAKVAGFIGGRVEDEVRFRFYELTAPEEVVKAAHQRVSRIGSTPRYRRLSTKLITEKILKEKYPDYDLFPAWNDILRNGIGLMLLEFSLKFGLIETFINRQGKKTTKYIRLTQKFIKIHDEKYEKMQSVCYKSEPMIEPAKDWVYRDGPAKNNWTGGYHNDFIRKQHRLCRGYNYESEFSEQSIRFLNMLNKTAWTVDHSIVRIANALKEHGISAGKFNAYQRPDSLDDQMPIELTKLPTDHPERANWRQEMARAHKDHNDEWRKAVRSVKSLQSAEKYLKYPRFFLSWSNDYRGRVYPQQPWLNPQTTEFEKSLIKFADGCKLDERGEWWAAQAIGAAYLGTSLNLQERVRWTHDNVDLLTRIATEPESTVKDWEQAKEPWQFLQLAIEWHKVVLTKQEQLWHIPVGADATASGLQLLSSMLLDPVGMKYSNVLPPEEIDAPPQDSYMRVLEITKELAGKDPEAMHLVQHLIHRKIGKTTMQMLYGATHGTTRNKVIQVFKQDLGLYPKTVTWKDCDKIAYLVEEASRQVFPAAYAALDWLADLAKEATKAAPGHFMWTTPSGDVIKLKEHKSISLDIRTSHLGKIRIPIATSEERDYKRMSSALPPSFIHSYDASLLKLAFDGWKQPLAVIHDCFKALPTDMESALDNIRRGFYAACEGDKLADLANTLGVDKDQLETLPQGSGDLKAVFDSTFLFN